MKNLKLVLVMLACFVGSLAWQSAKAYTVYFVDNGIGWTSPNAYIYNDTYSPVKYNQGWPGMEMTDSGKKLDGKTVYVCTFNPDGWEPANVIFNKNGSETSKPAAKAGALYKVAGNNSIETVENPVFDGGGDDPDPTPAGKLYMFGNINGTDTWSDPTNGLNLGTPVSNVYTYKITFTAAKSWFKFKYGDKQFNAETNDMSVQFDAETTSKTSYGNGNAFMIEAGTGTNFELNKEYTLTVNYNGTGDELTFKISGEAPQPTYPSTIQIRGWKSGEGNLKTYTSSERDAEGKYKFNLNFDKNINWFFETADARYVPAVSGNQTVLEGTTYASQKKAITYTSTQFSSTVGDYNCTAWFEEDGTISFTFAKETVEETWPDLYIIGEFTESWKFRERFMTSSTDGVYTWKLSSFPYGGQEWKISGLDFSVEYSAGEIMPLGNASARTIDYNKSYVCNTKTKDESKGLGNMILATDATVPVTVTLDLTGTTLRISVETEGEVVEPNKYLTIYMSFGQSRLTEGDRNKAPRIHFFTSRQSGSFDSNSLAALNDPEMTKTFPNEPNSPLWQYTISEEQLSSIEDVMFYFYKPGFDTDNSRHEQFIAGLADNWDTDNWTKFIYFADNGKASQSYITFEQYKDIRTKEKDKLYLIGQGFSGLNGWSPMPASDGTLSTLEIEASEGVFYKDIKRDGDLATSTPPGEEECSGAKFKMSWIRPYTYWLASDKSGGDQDAQRSWATFNLGIVGYNLELQGQLGNDKLPVIVASNTDNNEVYCTPTRILPTNNYNQYDWFIREKYLSGDVTYTLVVDLNPECLATCLLPCSPNPTVKASGVTYDVADLTEDVATAMDIWENSTDRLNAESVNGRAVFTKFNVATAEADIEAVNHDLISALTDPVSGKTLNYEIHYELFSGEQSVGTYDGKPGAVAITGVSQGDKAALGVRARYVSPVTGLQFHSKFNSATIEVADMAALDAPTVGEVTEKTFTHGSNNLDSETEPFYTLGAYALVPVTAPSTTLEWYPDFKLTTEGHHAEHPQHANGGEIVNTTHAAASLPVVNITTIDYTPWADGDFNPEIHDWTGKLKAAGAWPLHLPEVVKIERTYSEDGKTFEETPAKASVKVETYAVYPFLTDPNAKVRVSAANSPKAVRRKVALDPDVNYVVKLEHSPVTESSVAEFALGSGDLTAVKDIIAPAAVDGEVEYYNLQGVRMHGELAPGLYIRRQGSETSKVVIR